MDNKESCRQRHVIEVYGLAFIGCDQSHATFQTIAQSAPAPAAQPAEAEAVEPVEAAAAKPAEAEAAEPTEAAAADEAPEQQEPTPADRFIDRVKAIFTEAGRKNGQTIAVNAKGWSGQYTFYIDVKRITAMLDDLRRNSATKVVEYLGSRKSSVSVSAVAPFVGGILDIEELRVKELQKSDLKFALEPFYGRSATAVTKLSSRLQTAEGQMLVSIMRGLLRKYPKSKP